MDEVDKLYRYSDKSFDVICLAFQSTPTKNACGGKHITKWSSYFWTDTKSPDLITEEELRLYFLYLKNDQQISRSGFTIALCGLKFFYERTLHREWATLDLPRRTREKKLPAVLSVAEVRHARGV
jgi:hypothetical protein